MDELDTQFRKGGQLSRVKSVPASGTLPVDAHPERISSIESAIKWRMVGQVSVLKASWWKQDRVIILHDGLDDHRKPRVLPRYCGHS